MQPTNKELELFDSLGFSRIEVSVASDLGLDVNAFGQISEKSIVIQGNRLQDKQEDLVNSIDWWSGPIVFLRDEPPRYIIFEKFFCFEMSDLKRPFLSFRDFFDNQLTVMLDKKFSNISPIIGPSWSYIYSCDPIENTNQISKLVLKYPCIGNALMVRGNNFYELFNRRLQVKDVIQRSVPLPFLWAHPKKLPLDAKDNLFESVRRKWYIVSVSGNFQGEVSLVDLVQDTSSLLELTSYDPTSGLTEQRKISPEDIILQLVEVGGQFAVEKKLSQITIDIRYV